jgi:two-component system sensor histidine kinase YesM
VKAVSDVFDIQKKFNRFHSIAVQLFFFFFIGMIVPVLLGGYLSYNKSAKMIKDQVSQVASLTITQVSDKMNLVMKKLEDTSMMILYSKVLREALEGNPDKSKYENELNNQEAVRYVSSLMSNSTDILNIYIFDHYKQNSVFSKKNDTFINHWETDWYDKIIKADGRPVWFGLSYTSYLKGVDLGFPVYGLGRSIKNIDTGKTIGVLFIEVRGYSMIKELRNVKFGETGYTFIVDEANRYVYHPDETLYGAPSEFNLSSKMTVKHEKDPNVLVIPDALENGWRITGVVSVEELVADSIEIRNLTIWIASASILFAIIMGYYVTRKIGRPLVNLSKLMKRGEAGDLTVRCNVVGRNELGQLGRSFNKMIEQIDALIRRIGEEESQKKKAEIRALRYQINPHFLYNTLNSIRWMAKLHRNEEVVNAISTLVHLLEASMERNGAFVRLGEEIDLLEKYMIIQHYRYDYQITLKVDCPENLKEISIPRMILQPIVENAIFHGIAPKEEAGVIEIKVYQSGTDVMIKIIDDGIGIEDAKVARILSSDKETKTGGMTNIGLRHVHQTLQLHYGNLYGVTVSSKEDAGTVVQLTFSIYKGDQHVQSAIG